MKRIIGFHIVVVLCLALTPATVAHAQDGNAYDADRVYDALTDYFNREIGTVELLDIIDAELEKGAGGPPEVWKPPVEHLAQVGTSNTCGGERQPPLPEAGGTLMWFCDERAGRWTLVDVGHGCSSFTEWNGRRCVERSDLRWDDVDTCTPRQSGWNRTAERVVYRSNPDYVGDTQPWLCQPAWKCALYDDLLAPPQDSGGPLIDHPCTEQDESQP